jgi:hypothetical protein
MGSGKSSGHIAWRIGGNNGVLKGHYYARLRR